MLKKFFAISLLVVSISGCSSLENISMTNPFQKESIPNDIQAVVVSRVDVEKDIYAVGVSEIPRSGSLIAQSKANKKGMKDLTSQINQIVKITFEDYEESMAGYSKNALKDVKSDLIQYATEVSLKKVSQKGAWEDNKHVYSLLVVKKSDIKSITTEVLKNFLDNTTKKINKIKEGL